MQRPYLFTAIHNKTGEIKMYDHALFHPRTEWEEISPGISKEVNNWTVYIDTRHEAKKRLWHYITGTKPVKYRPFEGTEIGKSIPILNF